MALPNTHRSMLPKRSKTKEVLAVAGLTAAEYSSSFAVQEYLSKTIQNASQHPNVNPDLDKCKSAAKPQKPSKVPQKSPSQIVARSPSKLRNPSKEEKMFSRRLSSPTAGHRLPDQPQQYEHQPQQCQVHRHTQMNQMTAQSSNKLQRQLPRHVSLSQLSLAGEPPSVRHRYQNPSRGSAAAAAAAAGIRDSKGEGYDGECQRQHAMLVSMQKAKRHQAARKINEDKLGRREEALGSHPPLVLLEKSCEDRTGPKVPSGSSCSE